MLGLKDMTEIGTKLNKPKKLSSKSNVVEEKPKLKRNRFKKEKL